MRRFKNSYTKLVSKLFVFPVFCFSRDLLSGQADYSKGKPDEIVPGFTKDGSKEEGQKGEFFTRYLICF